jgi:uncharacterized protein (DUF2062 family)
MKEKISAFLKRLTLTDGCPKKLAAAVGVGVYMAFCPFFGFHILMALCIAWFFSLNAPIIFAVSTAIHNPWTVIPIYATNYVCGDYVLSHWCGLDPAACNPCWMQSCNSFITSHTGLPSLSLWSFVLGGNILGIGLGLLAYPMMKRFFMRMLKIWRTQNENNNAK